MKNILIALIIVLVALGAYLFMPSSDSSSQTQGELTAMKSSSISKAKLQELLPSQQEFLQTHGLTLNQNVTPNQLIITDSNKALHYLFESLRHTVPSAYTEVVNNLEDEITINVKDGLNGTTFGVEVTEVDNTPLLKVALTTLPTHITLPNTPSANAFKTLLSDGKVALLIGFNAQGEFNRVDLQNMNETLHLENNKTVTLVSNGLSSRMEGNMSAQFNSELDYPLLSIASKADHNTFNLTLKELHSKGAQTKILNQRSTTSLEELSFSHKDIYEAHLLKFIGIIVESAIHTKDGKVAQNYDIKTKVVQFTEKSVGYDHKESTNLDVKLNDFTFNVEASKLDEATLLDKQYFTTGTTPGQEDIKQLIALLNKGLSFEIKSLGAKNITVSMMNGAMGYAFRDFDISLKLDVMPNTYDPQSTSPMMLIPFVKLNARIAINDKDLTALTNTFPMLSMVAMQKELSGELATFTIVFDNGSLTINGNPIPVPGAPMPQTAPAPTAPASSPSAPTGTKNEW